MQLYSTKHQSPDVDLREATFRGLPPDNGLYLPHHIPVLPESFYQNIGSLSLQEIAFEVSKALLAGAISDQDLRQIIHEAIDFDAPVVTLDEETHILELFHGPSLAFKDFGARFMARLMSYFLEKEQQDINILVATSGDTGSAVAQGFFRMPHIRITILYPSQKVSVTQEQQLTTLGHNITALEIDGTFDDCQRLVKQAFLDPDLTRQLNLSSANSINISRLLPQSFYYFYAYAQLAHTGKPVVFSVPSGNFGNLCAGLIAKKMGLPVAKFVAATNVNDVVPNYLLSGELNIKPSVKTISNSMDVGNPSNFQRLLALYNDDIDQLRTDLVGRRYDDEETREAIKVVYAQYGYVLDPHTAVAYLGLQSVVSELGKPVNGIALATAHPSKFREVVEEALNITVEIPERLQQTLEKEKKSILMSSDFQDFKAFLLSTVPA
jgi:threonine synthase